MTSIRTMTASLLTALAMMAAPPPLAAQEADSTGTKTEAEDAVCLERALPAVAQVEESRRGQMFRIVATGKASRGLETRGFRKVDCAAAGLDLAEGRSAYRDEVCALAAAGNEAVQNQIERALGERAAALCASAEIVAGPWKRPAGDRVAE
jgi:hypothetical protein